MSRTKILVVDDSPTSILWQRLILEGAGFQVLSARDGLEGVRAALDQHPAVVLLDVVMPNMDGFEACRILRGHPDTKDVPVIMLTTRSEMQSISEGFASGCNEYITKPIDRTELLAKVRACLHGHGVDAA